MQIESLAEAVRGLLVRRPIPMPTGEVYLVEQRWLGSLFLADLVED